MLNLVPKNSGRTAVERARAADRFNGRDPGSPCPYKRVYKFYKTIIRTPRGIRDSGGYFDFSASDFMARSINAGRAIVVAFPRCAQDKWRSTILIFGKRVADASVYLY